VTGGCWSSSFGHLKKKLENDHEMKLMSERGDFKGWMDKLTFLPVLLWGDEEKDAGVGHSIYYAGVPFSQSA
jgi:hypothetical protein